MRALLLLLIVLPGFVSAQDVTVATFNCEFLVRRSVHVKFGEGLRLSTAKRAQWDQPGYRDARFAEGTGAVAAVLALVDADILLLTEVGDDTDVQQLQDSLAARGAVYPHRFVGDSADNTTGQHVAVLSRFPLSNPFDAIPGRAIYLKEPDDPDSEDDTGLSKALRVTADIPGHPLILYLAHLVSERGGYEADAQRMAQTEVLRRHMLPALLADSLVLVAGDLNDGRGQPPLHYLRGLSDPFPDLIQTGLSTYFDDEDVDQRWTYTFNGERNQIDHILLSFGVKDATRRTRGIQTRTVDHGNPLASDHRPLVVTLHFTE